MVDFLSSTDQHLFSLTLSLSLSISLSLSLSECVYVFCEEVGSWFGKAPSLAQWSTPLCHHSVLLTL